MSSDGGSVGRRRFDRHIAEDQLVDLRQRLLDQGVSQERLDAELDLSGLAAEVNTLASVAVGFADLAGFTSLSGRISPSELAGIVDAFDEHVSELVLTHGGQVVKLIGDEVMFVADDAADGLRIAQALAVGLPGAEDLPAVRVGAACGEVLNRDGDYYGSVVNLAARLVALAEPGEVLVDARLALVAGDAAVEPLPEVEVKGFPDPVTPYRLVG